MIRIAGSIIVFGFFGSSLAWRRYTGLQLQITDWSLEENQLQVLPIIETKDDNDSTPWVMVLIVL